MVTPVRTHGRQIGYHYTVVSRLVRKHTLVNNVKNLPRSGRPRVTSDRDDSALQRLVRGMPFATTADYSIVVANLTSNSFEGHPCCMHADYLPSLCFWYSPSYHAYWKWIFLTGEKTHTSQQCEKLAKIRQTTGNIWSWRQCIAAFG
jgi:hypothetical protein